GLGSGAVRLGCRVAKMMPGAVELTDGEQIRAREIVVATGGDESVRLAEAGRATAWRSVTCVQWAAPVSPLHGEPMLWLNGRGRGLINNLVVPSDVAAGYAPDGQALVSTTILGETVEDDAALTLQLKAELAGLFGSDVLTWRALAVQRVRRALPVLKEPRGAAKPVRHERGFWRCGDHLASASIQGAMESGASVARAILG
nr:FAD-dependent oxidoreductase [Opitutaceae bacterium]